MHGLWFKNQGSKYPGYSFQFLNPYKSVNTAASFIRLSTSALFSTPKPYTVHLSASLMNSCHKNKKKYEIRISKYETNFKIKCLNDRNNHSSGTVFLGLFSSLEIMSFDIVSNFVLLISYFRFIRIRP